VQPDGHWIFYKGVGYFTHKSFQNHIEREFIHTPQIGDLINNEGLIVSLNLLAITYNYGWAAWRRVKPEPSAYDQTWRLEIAGGTMHAAINSGLVLTDRRIIHGACGDFYIVRHWSKS
jgi:hypothetical protein